MHSSYTFEEISALFFSFFCCSSPFIIIALLLILSVILIVCLVRKNKNTSNKSVAKNISGSATAKKNNNLTRKRYYVQDINSRQTNIVYQPPIQKPVQITIPKVEQIQPQEESEYSPYYKKHLLTKHELDFYKDLKVIADKRNLTILTKIRMADLLGVNAWDHREKYIYFNKISRKHVDFALADPSDLKILLLIELDDSSHDIEQTERDKFVESVYSKTDYKLLRVRNSIGLNEKISLLL